jgi:hypothetical protein
MQRHRAVYGKVSDDEDGSCVVPQNIIPRLQPEFFDSPFFRRLHIQRESQLYAEMPMSEWVLTQRLM